MKREVILLLIFITSFSFVSSESDSDYICEDPTGDDIYKKGYATGYSGENNRVLRWGDHCTDGTGRSLSSGPTLYEATCINNEVKYVHDITCPNGCLNGACVERVEPTGHISGSICGDRICGVSYSSGEEESYGGSYNESSGSVRGSCPYDCSSSCRSEFCNDKVEVYCASSTWPYIELSNESCFGEYLFDDYMEIQTVIYDCLSDYFNYNSSKVNYAIFKNSLSQVCNLEEGCYGRQGGRANSFSVFHFGLMGFVPFGESHPTQKEHLTADVHETTHYFIWQMLHRIPGWFSEAIAIQTAERLVCHPQQPLWGDAHLSEIDNDTGRIILSDGTTLDKELYYKLKNQEIILQESLRNDHHIGTLYIIGLREDFGCEKDCIKEIVSKLKDYEDLRCKDVIYDNEGFLLCGSMIPAEVIRQKTEEVVGQDVTYLFNLLEIGSEPLEMGSEPSEIESNDNTTSNETDEVDEEESEPSEIEEIEDSCDYGCTLDDLCYLQGHRKSGMYCSETLNFVNQSGENQTCEHHFECVSNACLSGKCSRVGWIEDFLNWLRRLFNID